MEIDSSGFIDDYQRNLPQRIITYLRGRGISEDIIGRHRLGWNGERITIPIFRRDGAFSFFKLAKDPEDRGRGSKMLATRGSSVELYGWERLSPTASRIVLCEGEYDRLVLESQGIAAVTSTGGAGSFRSEWAADFAPVQEVYICFDRDAAGRRGGFRLGQFIPHAKIVDLPDEVGDGGDVTDFFVRLGRSRDDFEQLLVAARPIPAPPPTLPTASHRAIDDSLSARIAALKRAVPIADVVERYVALRASGLSLRGRCPFHEDHHPSLMVYGTTGTFRCYGCGRHGDVIDFVMTIERLPFLRALDVLSHHNSNIHEQLSAE